MPPTPQSYANHARQRPVYWVAYLVFFVNLIWTMRRAWQAPSMDTLLNVAVALALLVLAFYARVFALTVQDRVIRLEMRLRLRELSPAALQPRIHEFTKSQLVAMRFASDAELPALAEQVLREDLHDSKAIKQAIKDWTPDHLRA
jgi:hypothetical protein